VLWAAIILIALAALMVVEAAKALARTLRPASKA